MMFATCTRCGVMRPMQNISHTDGVCMMCIKAERVQPREGEWPPGLLCDEQIRYLAESEGMIDPFSEAVKSGISYGLTSYGYDMRVAGEWKVFTDFNATIVDPKRLDASAFREVDGDVIIPPNSFALARSIERFKVPNDILAIVLGKSTYARCGLVVNCTPLEPCLSADSEVLTSDGWVSMAGVDVGDGVLTRRADGTAEYQAVERKQEHHYTGDMMHFSGRSVDQLVTPDHKLFVWRRNPHARTYQGMTIEAAEVFGKHGYSFDREVMWYSKEPTFDTVHINGLDLPTNAFLRFLGCWLGDGSAYRASDGGYVVKLAAVTKARKFDYYRRVLRDLGIDNAYRHERGYKFYSKPLATYLMQFGHAREKFIDRRWMFLPPEKLALILDGLIESDGNRETMTFTTSSKRLADDVQELIYKTGSAAIVREAEGGVCTAYKVRVSDKHLTPKMSPRNHRKIPYDGPVYDVTVPNHVFLMRRDGKASWTGNCWEGYLTVEVSNTTPLPARVYAGEGIAQVLFYKGSRPCAVDYASKSGKYQDQPASIVLPKVTS